MKKIILFLLMLLSTLYFVNKESLIRYVNNTINKNYNIGIQYKSFLSNNINQLTINNIDIIYKKNIMGTINKTKLILEPTGLNIQLSDIYSDMTLVLPRELKKLRKINIQWNYIDYLNIKIKINQQVECNYSINKYTMTCDKYNNELNNLLKGNI